MLFQKNVFRTRMMKIKIKIFTFQLSRFLGGGGEGHFWIFPNKDEKFFINLLNKDEEKNFQKFTQQRWRPNFTKISLNKNEKFFLEFLFLLDKHFSEKRKFHRKGWRKISFWKSGQGSSLERDFFCKKSKNFQRQEIENIDFFQNFFLKFWIIWI